MKRFLLATALTALASPALLAHEHAGGPGGAMHGPRDMHEPRAMFEKADQNGDGAVSREEARAAATAHANEWFDKMDSNKDGRLTQEEARQGRKEGMAKMKARFEEHFKSADKNGDGSVSREEAGQGMPMLARQFDTVDTNKDGSVSREEMRAHHMKMHEQRHGEGSKDMSGHAH